MALFEFTTSPSKRDFVELSENDPTIEIMASSDDIITLHTWKWRSRWHCHYAYGPTVVSTQVFVCIETMALRHNGTI